MLRAISIKLNTATDQSSDLLGLQSAYASACNDLVPVVIANRCWNRVALHHLAYYEIRAISPLGSQMVCNTIFSVCKAYKAQAALNRIRQTVRAISFDRASVHFDKRTYSIKDNVLSLYSLSGRIKVPMILGDFQHRQLDGAAPKEAELALRKGQWFFNLVLEVKTPETAASDPVLGANVGENNLVATSTGKLFCGGDLRDRRDRRDRFLALRKRLQSNGSASTSSCWPKSPARKPDA